MNALDDPLGTRENDIESKHCDDKLAISLVINNHRCLMNLLLSMSVFIDIVEAGSLQAAALKLNISPTMVGKHLKALEEQLQSQLLTRTTRRLV